MVVESEFVVLARYTDGLGHLNHVSAIQLFEYARDDWYQQCGLWGGRQWSRGEVFGTIVVNVNFNYRLECFLAEKLTVRTSPVGMGAKSYVLSQEMIKESGDIAIEGRSTSVIMNMGKREIIAVPDPLSRYLPKRNG